MALVNCARRLSLFNFRQSAFTLCTTTSKGSHDPPKEDPAEKPEPPHEAPDELTQLYDAVLLQVPEHGWTDEAITQAVNQLGWSIASKRMIARGPVQVIEEFTRRCNRQLAHDLALKSEKEGVTTEADIDKAVYAIRERISMIEPYHSCWARALALQALPQNSPYALKQSALMIDEIAHYSGFSHPDISWYSDRAVLGVAYHATELYWLTDRSLDRQDTWQFLERRLKDSSELRTRVANAYNGLMNLSDATTSSISTLIKSVRRSY